MFLVNEISMLVYQNVYGLFVFLKVIHVNETVMSIVVLVNLVVNCCNSVHYDNYQFKIYSDYTEYVLTKLYINELGLALNE